MNNNEISREEMLYDFVKEGINGHKENGVIDLLFDMIKCDFTYYSYVQDRKTLKGGSADKVPDNGYEYEVNFNDAMVCKFKLSVNKENVSEFQKKALEYAGYVVLLLYKEKVKVEITDIGLKQELVSDICTGNLKSREELKIRCEVNGWDIKDNVVVVIFDLDEFKKKTVDFNERNKKIEIIKEKLFKELRNAFLEADFTFYNFQISDSIIFVFENNEKYNQKRDEVFAKLMKDAKEDYNFTYTVGIGRAVTNIFDAPISYEEARQAVKIGRSMLGLGLIHEYKDLELFSLLNQAVNKDILAGELMSPIRRLLDYDRENSSEYYNFLKEFINSNWSLTRTAENNYIHYNTAKYRLKKVEEIIGMQVEDTNARFRLELALRLYELKNMV